MFFWNSSVFSMIQRMLAIWSLVPLPFLKPAWTSGSSWFTYCWSLAWRILIITLLYNEWQNKGHSILDNKGTERDKYCNPNVSRWRVSYTWQWKLLSLCLTLCDPCDPMCWSPHGILQARVGSHSLLQGIIPTQELNPGLRHCRQILYQLSHQRSPRILEWVAIPFSSRSSQPRDRTGVSWIAGTFFPNWAIREA